MDFEQHYLYPSNLIVIKTPGIIKTILGSCVAVCIWDKLHKQGGMNHFMLPYWNGKGLASPKHGNIAISKLIEQMIDNGSSRNNLIAKIFGGGEVISVQNVNFHIGERNILVAKDLLKDEKINIVSESVGGKLGRKIQFNTYSGTILMNYIKNTNIN